MLNISTAQIESAIADVLKTRLSVGAMCISVDQVRACLYRRHRVNPDMAALAVAVRACSLIKESGLASQRNCFYPAAGAK